MHVRAYAQFFIVYHQPGTDRPEAWRRATVAENIKKNTIYIWVILMAVCFLSFISARHLLICTNILKQTIYDAIGESIADDKWFKNLKYKLEYESNTYVNDLEFVLTALFLWLPEKKKKHTQQIITPRNLCVKN